MSINSFIKIIYDKKTCFEKHCYFLVQCIIVSTLYSVQGNRITGCIQRNRLQDKFAQI